MRPQLTVSDGGSLNVGTSTADIRMIGADGERVLRQAVWDASCTLSPKPNPELFKSINKDRNVNLSLLLAGVVTIARSPRLKRPAWNRLESTALGWFRSQVTPVSEPLIEVLGDETRATGNLDVATLALLACNSNDIDRVRDARRACEAQLFHTERLLTMLSQTERDLQRGVRVLPFGDRRA